VKKDRKKARIAQESRRRKEIKFSLSAHPALSRSMGYAF
jgi:hypothetical protein